MRAILAAVAALGLAASAQATVLYSFEGSLEGWSLDGTTVQTIAQSTTGATQGTGSLALSASTFGQIKADLSVAQWADVAASKKVSLDYTIPTTIWGSWGGWWGQINIAVNSRNGQWQGLATWTNLNLAVGAHTVTFDLSSLPIPADPGDYHQIFIQHNWGGQKLDQVDGGPTGPSTLYIDNIQTLPVPEPTVVAGLAAASLGLMIRKRQK